MERLTVSIVNYRTPGLVIECVASLKRHAPRDTQCDIVVIDNGSGDGSLATIALAYPDIRLIDAGANLGFAGGNNLALRECRSNWVLLLNSDTQVQEGTLDTLLQALRAHPDVGAVSSSIINASDGAEQDFPCRFPTLVEMGRRALRGPQHPAAGQTMAVELERLHGACMMIRGELLQSVGLLDEGFFMYDEDVDWCVRARRMGWKLWLVPTSKVVHHGGKSTGRPPSGQRAGFELNDTALRMRLELRRSRYRLYRKHRAAWELWALKLLTDLATLCSSIRPLLDLLSPARRPAGRRLLHANGQILALNPRAMETASHASHL